MKPAKTARVNSPDAPGEGFQGWAEDAEARLERQAPQRERAEALVVEVRVVYLGSNRRKTQPLPGALLDHDRPDGTKVSVPAPRETEGILSYDFAREDRHGRPITTRLTHDLRPFAIVRHIGHLAWFSSKTDAEGNPEYELRGTAEALEKVKAYIDRRRMGIGRDREHPVNVIAAMGNPWGELGGEIGEPVAG